VRSLPYQSAYSAAKHGIEGFIEAMRLELQHANIAVNVTSVKPAVINTPFWNSLTKLGVKPAGIPPYYDPRLVADAILYVAEHPTRDFYVRDSARTIAALQRLSPELVDSLLLLIGFQGQRSNQPKSLDDRNNLYEPVPSDTRVDGDYSHMVIPSVTDWPAKNPVVQWGAIAGVMALTFLATQSFNREK
jgi:hypothetical protein